MATGNSDRETEGEEKIWDIQRCERLGGSSLQQEFEEGAQIAHVRSKAAAAQS